MNRRLMSIQKFRSGKILTDREEPLSEGKLLLMWRLLMRLDSGMKSQPSGSHSLRWRFRLAHQVETNGRIIQHHGFHQAQELIFQYYTDTRNSCREYYKRWSYISEFPGSMVPLCWSLCSESVSEGQY